MTRRRPLPNHALEIRDGVNADAQIILDVLKPIADGNGRNMSAEHLTLRALRASNAALRIREAIAHLEIRKETTREPEDVDC
jgi:hypothetical protein